MRALVVFLLSSLFYFYQYFLQVTSDVLSVNLMSEFSVTEHRVGILSAAFFLSYTLMQIPAGILLDRLGTQRILPLATMLCALSCIIFGLAPYFFVASLARIIMGCGAAFSFIGSIKLIVYWFPKQRFTFYSGILLTIGILGAIVGEVPFAYLVEVFGWRNSMLLLGVLGVALSLCLFLFINETPEIISPESDNSAPQKKKWSDILKKKQLWIIAGYFACASTPITLLTMLLGVPFIMA